MRVSLLVPLANMSLHVTSEQEKMLENLVTPESGGVDWLEAEA